MPAVVRVLVVDDSEQFRQLVLSILRGMPEVHVIAEASDGLEAVAMAQELHPDLIILDIGLPKLNGIAAARQIRELSPKSRVLFLTQVNSIDIVEEGMRLGAWGYIVKADAGRELIAAIKSISQGQPFLGNRFDPEFRERLLKRPDPPQAEPESTCSHSVLIYSKDQEFLDCMAKFMANNLNAGNSAVLIAKPEHREQLPATLKANGVDLEAAITEGRYIECDSTEILANVMVNGLPDRDRIFEAFGQLFKEAISYAKSDQPCVSACGECSPLLLEQGNAQAAIQMEHITSDVVTKFHVNILCGYPQSSFQGERDKEVFHSICSKHSSVQFGCPANTTPQA